MLGDLHRVERPTVVDLDQQVVLLLQRGLDLQPQDRLVEQVLDPQPDPVDLVRVRRPDAAAGGADLGLAQEALGDLVDHLVVAGDDVRVGRDDHVRGVDAAGGQSGDLAEQHVEVDDHPVADDRDAVGVQDARRQQVQRVPLAADHDGVAGVVAAGVADAVVDAVAQLVGGLALALRRPIGRPPPQCPASDRRLPVSHPPVRRKISPWAFAAGTLATQPYRTSCAVSPAEVSATRDCPVRSAKAVVGGIAEELRAPLVLGLVADPFRGHRQRVQRTQETAVGLVLPGDRSGAPPARPAERVQSAVVAGPGVRVRGDVGLGAVRSSAPPRPAGPSSGWRRGGR